MNTIKSISADKKMTVICRVEAGCLGPTGDKLVEDFCLKSVEKFQNVYSDMVNFQLEPRYNKTLTEIQYTLLGKTLSREQANKYLAVFDQDIDKFELSFTNLLTDLIHEAL